MKFYRTYRSKHFRVLFLGWQLIEKLLFSCELICILLWNDFFTFSEWIVETVDLLIVVDANWLHVKSQVQYKVDENHWHNNNNKENVPTKFVRLLGSHWFFIILFISFTYLVPFFYCTFCYHCYSWLLTIPHEHHTTRMLFNYKIKFSTVNRSQWLVMIRLIIREFRTFLVNCKVQLFISNVTSTRFVEGKSSNQRITNFSYTWNFL